MGDYAGGPYTSIHSWSARPGHRCRWASSPPRGKADEDVRPYVPSRERVRRSGLTISVEIGPGRRATYLLD
jgi:hypothetical protein